MKQLFSGLRQAIVLASICGALVAAFLAVPASAFAATVPYAQTVQAPALTHQESPVTPFALDPPTCTGAACSGQNAFATYCAGQTWDVWSEVQAVALLNLAGQRLGTVELWYSTTCRTYWTRVTFHVPAGARLLGAQSTVSVAGRGTQTRTDRSRSHGALLSPQEYALAPAWVSASGSVVLQFNAQTILYAGALMAHPGA